MLTVVTFIRQDAKMIDGKGSETANGGAGQHMALREQRHDEPHTIYCCTFRIISGDYCSLDINNTSNKHQSVPLFIPVNFFIT